MTDKPTVGRIEFGPVPTEAERVAMKAQAFPEILRRRDDLAEEVARLRALLAEARAVIAPFAKIEPSTFYPEDGSEREGYEVFLSGAAFPERDYRRPNFTGADLARAREFMEESENV